MVEVDFSATAAVHKFNMITQPAQDGASVEHTVMLGRSNQDSLSRALMIKAGPDQCEIRRFGTRTSEDDLAKQASQMVRDNLASRINEVASGAAR